MTPADDVIKDDACCAGHTMTLTAKHKASQKATAPDERRQARNKRKAQRRARRGGR